jgi:hypothetical protein
MLDPSNPSKPGSTKVFTYFTPKFPITEPQDVARPERSYQT